MYIYIYIYISLHQVSFEGDTKFPRLAIRRRAGRPRENWLVNTTKKAYKEFVPAEFDESDFWNEHELNWLVDAARRRESIFETKPKSTRINCFSTHNDALDRTDTIHAHASAFFLWISFLVKYFFELSPKQVQDSNVLLGLVVAVLGALGAIVALGVDAL